MNLPFKHCTECGSAGLWAQSSREFVCAACGFRHFVTPIPAACALLLDAHDRLLLTRRAHEPGLGRLCVPGGVIEGGESGEEACAREVREEVGLSLAAAEFRYWMSLPNRYPFQGFIWPTLDLFYCARVPSFDEVMADASEVCEWMAVPLPEVPLAEFAFISNAEAVRLFAEQHSSQGSHPLFG
jgi:ADP-ribose pyrophosphatase YjhB (NUDIX family)